MELVVHIQDQDTLATALDHAVSGVAAPVPRDPEPAAWSNLSAWREEARRRGRTFFLTWDWLVPETDLPIIPDMLAAVARLSPDGLQLRDLGLIREARRLYPHLPLQAAANWGAHNSPAMQLAASLGFSQVVVEGPVSLRDLALMQRQTAMPLAVTLGGGCRGYASLCLMEEYLGLGCAACCLAAPPSPAVLMAALETFSGLCQQNLAAVHLRGEFFAPAALAQVIKLFQAVAAASPQERPRVLAAAREVLEAFGQGLRPSAPPAEPPPGSPVYPLPPSQRSAAPRSGATVQGRTWLEARDYPEVAALSRNWREPLVLALTPETYAAFLPDHRHWTPRRLIWRLPPVIPESAQAFYQKALETLAQGGYSRFVAGDWGGVALAGAAGGRVYADQTLGLRNSWSAQAARDLKIARACLPPGHRAQHWEPLLAASPPGSFWSYLYHCPTVAVCPPEAAALEPPENLRWIVEDGQALLCLKPSQNLLDLDDWFKQQAILPLLAALPHSPRPRGEIPPWLAPPQARPKPRPGPRKA
jgi:collagenase-like PrtC family protease